MNKLGRAVDGYLYLKTLFDNVYITNVTGLKVEIEVVVGEQIHNLTISNNLTEPTLEEQIEKIIAG